MPRSEPESRTTEASPCAGFAAGLDAMPGLAWLADAGGRWRCLNRGWLSFTGEAHGDLEGDGWRGTVHPDDLERVLAAWTDAVRRREPFDARFRMRRHDGAWRFFQARAEPRTGAPGGVTFHGVAIEIGGRARERFSFARAFPPAGGVEETGSTLDLIGRRAQLEAIFRFLPVGLTVVDLRGRILAMNDAALRMHGFATEEDLHARPDRRERNRVLCSLDGAPLPPEAWPSTRALQGDLVRDLELRLRDGQDRIVSCTVVPVLDRSGHTMCFVEVMQDVTERAHAEEALRRSEEQRRLALDAAELGTWDYKLISNEVYWDERFKRIVGVTDDRMAYHELVELRGLPEDRPKIHAELRRILGPTSDGTGTLEVRVRWPDGSIRWVQLRGQVFFEGSPPTRIPVRFVGTIADITARRQAEAALRDSEERFRLLADAMPQLVWITRPDGGVEYFNRRWFEYTGATLDESVGDGWSRYLHPDDLEPTLERWRRCAVTGEDYEVEYRFRRASDGSYRWFLGRALPIRDHDGRIQHWFGTCTEIHDVKQAQADLAVAKEHLEEADRRKNEFLAVLSHELRNPLAPILNGVHVLGRAEPGSEAARRAVEVIERQARHMTRLIDDLLDLTRISRGKVTLRRERLELNELALRTAEDHRELFARSGVELRIETADEPFHTDGDPTRLAQVIGNLLANSAKFTARGGHTTLSVGLDGAGWGFVRVSDDGTGMSAETLQHVFEPFVQADRTLERSRGGLGLGLALVKGLVEMHGGRVVADSRGPGKGAEFTITLPLAPASRERPEAPASTRPTRRRVLVIEDNVDAADSLREVLELADHEVAVAYTGPEGVEAARAFRPDVVLCDIGLPGLDGYAVARALRADPSVRSSRLVALSGYALPEDVQRAKEAGFDRHMAKPPSLDALEALIAEAPAGDAPAPP